MHLHSHGAQHAFAANDSATTATAAEVVVKEPFLQQVLGLRSRLTKPMWGLGKQHHVQQCQSTSLQRWLQILQT